jgi:predicted restriction endonuclease
MDERNSNEYKNMRKIVLKRDGNKCQFPGCNARRKLEVHHVCPWHIGPGRHEPSNCITLCAKHHGSIKNKELFYVDLFAGIIKANNNK